MRDFLIKPDTKSEYGLFLVRNLNNFNLSFLNSIFTDLKKLDFLISFERLFKDGESALVIFGPRKVLLNYQHLNLLELEDYAKLNLTDAAIFEADFKSSQDLRAHLPKLTNNERVWVQLICKGEKSFSSQLRVVIYSASKLKNLTEEFQTNFKGQLNKLPKPYSKSQLFEFYKMRSFIKGEARKMKIEDILNLSLFF